MKRHIQKLIDITVAIITEFYARWIYSPLVFFGAYRKEYHWYGLNPKTLSDEQAERSPIIFLHGQSHNQSGVLPLAKELYKAGISPVFSLNLTYDENKPERHQIKIRAFLEEIRSLYAQKGKDKISILLIGHSRGGIEAMNYLCLEPPQKGISIKKVIVIAARLTTHDMDIKLQRNKKLQKLINKINQSMSTHLPILYQIVAKYDLVVPLKNAIVISDKKRYHIVDRRSHLGVLYSKETHKKIIEFL